MCLKTKKIFLVIIIGLSVSLSNNNFLFAQSSQNPQSGSAGLTGVVPSEPPAQGATISFPTSGSVIEEVPIDVTGVCPQGLLVKLFKNEVFAGSVQCTNGSFTITTDLFSGSNQLIARVYDELDQPGPDSNVVTVTYNDAGIPNDIDRVTITTNFAKRGANPGEKLRWPMTITGGVGPYAIVIDWGDGEESLISLNFAGEFVAEHIYEKPGTYRIIVKASDSQGTTSFLQLVGVANGAVVDDNSTPPRVDENGNIIDDGQSGVTGGSTALGGGGLRFVVWPLYVMVALIIMTFWLGRRYEIKKLKRKLATQQALQ